VSLDKDPLSPGERFLSRLYDEGRSDADIRRSLQWALANGTLTQAEYDKALAFHLGA
jgi:hypothetical protein